jgi:hypothetical protein
MKLCERCGNYNVMLSPDRSMPSTPMTMPGSPSGTLTFFFPLEEEKFCYYCNKVLLGRIDTSSTFTKEN